MSEINFSLRVVASGTLTVGASGTADTAALPATVNGRPRGTLITPRSMPGGGSTFSFLADGAPSSFRAWWRDDAGDWKLTIANDTGGAVDFDWAIIELVPP